MYHLNRAPSLREWEDAVYILSYYMTEEEAHPYEPATLELHIKYSFHGDSVHNATVKDWNSYRFYVNTEEDSFQLVSTKAWQSRIETVSEMEGDDVADKVAEDPKYRGVFMKDGYSVYMSIFEALILRWESMLNLNLFTPSVNLSDRWQF